MYSLDLDLDRVKRCTERDPESLPGFGFGRRGLQEDRLCESGFCEYGSDENMLVS
jgi:hypothetical protein